ncbi:hypothetical protein INT43_004766 [Umbelopsis isabellina]|uniref:Major facilitator superfamily (MFS) profile domain-containing protein n=1 Tax=Mortierella isabellina TaxID=91625 RepID=A0A8H7PEJ7_MORIS|nr:hypothetical protein INT43_004766 [Umbelopsis isabellina]
MKHIALIATTIACFGGFLFGYDTGVISSVLVMPTFFKDLGIDPKAQPDYVSEVKGNVVALLQAGCCAGAILINFFADRWGRKFAIVLSSIIFVVGGILQVVAHNMDTMLAGRFVAGFGVGANSMLVPMYIAEIAPRRLRGRLGTLWQFLIVIGIMLSYWIGYGCLNNIAAGSLQWKVPLGIQIIPGGILVIGIPFMPESLRWLAAHGKMDQCRKTLANIRDVPEDDPSVIQEMEEIERAIELERESKSLRISEIFASSNLRRLFIGCMLQLFQQWTGTNAINYYAPEIFQAIGLSSAETQVLATGVYGCVKVAFVFVSFFMVDTKLGRRRTLMIGSVIMCAAFYILGGMIYMILQQPPNSAVGAKGYIAIIMVYVFAIGYEFSWGPIVWIVCSEIYPTRIRAMCLSLTTAINWAMNATIAKVTPIMLLNIPYGTYFLFGSFAVVMGLFVYFLLPETRGRSLEQMDEVFGQGILAFRHDNSVPTEKLHDDEERAVERHEDNHEEKHEEKREYVE